MVPERPKRLTLLTSNMIEQYCLRISVGKFYHFIHSFAPGEELMVGILLCVHRPVS